MEYFDYIKAVEDGYIVVGEAIDTCNGVVIVEYIIDDCDDPCFGDNVDIIEVGVVGMDEDGEEVFVPHGEIYSAEECW